MGIEALEERLRRDLGDRSDWLVFADWLLDQGDVRGRVTQLLLRAEVTSPGAIEAAQRELDAFVAVHHRALWIDGLTDLHALVDARQKQWGLDLGFRWRYGLVVGATLPCEVGVAELLVALVSHPSARLLATVALRGPPDQDHLPAVAELLSLDLPGIRALDLGDLGLEAEAARWFQSGPASGLLSLDLRNNCLGSRGARALAEASSLGGVRVLSLENNTIGADGVRALAASKALRSVEALDLRHNPIGHAGALALAESSGLPHLRRVTLCPQDVGRDGVRALSQSRIALDLQP